MSAGFVIDVSSHGAIPESTRRHLQDLLTRDSATKGTASFLLNNEGRRMVRIAKEISRGEIADRPDDRRTKESLAHGATYTDSWDFTPARANGYALEVRLTNSHPFARAVEKGTPPHEITASNAPAMAFPFKPGAPRGSEGKLGGWAVNFGDAPTRLTRIVSHPGAAAHRIGARTVLRWLSETPLRRAR